MEITGEGLVSFVCRFLLLMIVVPAPPSQLELLLKGTKFPILYFFLFEINNRDQHLLVCLQESLLKCTDIDSFVSSGLTESPMVLLGSLSETPAGRTNPSPPLGDVEGPRD